MAIGAKKVETRPRYLHYRGWLAIQASKGGLSKRDLAAQLKEFGPLALAGETIHPGNIVAVVNLIDCCPTTYLRGPLPVFELYPEYDTVRLEDGTCTGQERKFGNYSPGRWAWVTSKLFRLPEPIPFKAHQGICIVPPEVVDEIRRQGWQGEEIEKAA